ncbi:MAG: hypothetical protein II721_08410, partial [Bacilli bacterium]|nr:hypothetical protein [Bacilli bacterium]
MKKHSLLVVIVPLLLSSCGGGNSNTSSSVSVTSEESVTSITSEEESVTSITSEEESSSSETSSESETISSEEGSSDEEFDMAPINKELEACFQYFNDTTNLSETSAGYGLVQDRYTEKQLCSIAATGFALASIPVFVEEGYLTLEEGLNRASKTLDTVLRIQADSSTSYEGCISHFVNRRNGSRNGTSEISTIDTAILISGALTAGGYFEGEVEEKAM